MGEAGRVRGLPGPEEQHLHPGLQWGREGHSVAPISRRGHTSSSPAKGRRACRHPHSSGLERGLWAPEAPGVPALLSRKGPARARQPGHHHLDSPGLPCDHPPHSAPRRPQYQTVAQREAYNGPSLGSPKVSLARLWTGLSRDSQDRGLHTQARRVTGPRLPQVSTGELHSSAT